MGRSGSMPASTAALALSPHRILLWALQGSPPDGLEGSGGSDTAAGVAKSAGDHGCKALGLIQGRTRRGAPLGQTEKTFAFLLQPPDLFDRRVSDDLHPHHLLAIGLTILAAVGDATLEIETEHRGPAFHDAQNPVDRGDVAKHGLRPDRVQLHRAAGFHRPKLADRFLRRCGKRPLDQLGDVLDRAVLSGGDLGEALTGEPFVEDRADPLPDARTRLCLCTWIQFTLINAQFDPVACPRSPKPTSGSKQRQGSGFPTA